ncbi:MAG TPA: hypothetical protein VFI59_08915 [Actinomycetota bacterium]|nr:hypothetical protein [Actinomycetota bacterium]
MDQTFNFRAAPVPLRRRLNPRALALAVAALVTLSGIASCSRWVIDSERRSIERAERAGAVTSIIGTISGGDDAAESSSVSGAQTIDAPARSDTLEALDAARRAAAGRASFLDAGPGQLSSMARALIFVDGPSPVTGVVSVASTQGAWAAAVMGPSGTCYWLRFSPGEGPSYGTGEPCTGDAALAASSDSW